MGRGGGYFYIISSESVSSIISTCKTLASSTRDVGLTSLSLMSLATFCDCCKSYLDVKASIVEILTRRCLSRRRCGDVAIGGAL